MTRETKIGLVVGLGFIIVLGVIISDRGRGSRTRNAPPMTEDGFGSDQRSDGSDGADDPFGDLVVGPGRRVPVENLAPELLDRRRVLQGSAEKLVAHRESPSPPGDEPEEVSSGRDEAERGPAGPAGVGGGFGGELTSDDGLPPSEDSESLERDNPAAATGQEAVEETEQANGGQGTTSVEPPRRRPRKLMRYVRATAWPRSRGSSTGTATSIATG